MAAFLRERLRTFVFLAALLTLPGCFEYDETITVHDDGRVTVAVFAQVMHIALPALINRPEVSILVRLANNRHAADQMLPDNIKVTRSTVTRDDTWMYYDYVFEIPNLTTANSEFGQLLKGQTIQLYEDGDRYVYHRSIGKPEMDENADGPIRRLMADKLEQIPLRFKLVTPLPIDKANGIQSDDNTVRWEFNMAQVKAAGVTMTASIHTSSGGQALYIAAIGGVGLLILIIWFALRKPNAENTSSESLS